MNFFNQKEEVLEIELTQYGKRMLSIGKFRPTHYAFYDKDILYNSECSIGAEEQNSAESRIKTGTPRIKVQYNFIGADTQYQEMREVVTNTLPGTDAEKKERLQDTENRFFNADYAIGTTKLQSVYQPSWKLNFYSDNLQSASMAITSSVLSHKTFPQLEAKISYNTHVVTDLESVNIEPGSDKVNLLPQDYGAHPDLPLSEFAEGNHDYIQFEDKSAIILKEDFLLIGIEEENTDFFKDNFEVEFFLIEHYNLEGMGIQQKLTPLYFDEVDDSPFAVDETQVKYFFEVAVDEEIPQSVLCSLVPKHVKRNIYLKDIFDCEDIMEQNSGFGNIYEDDELGEPC